MADAEGYNDGYLKAYDEHTDPNVSYAFPKQQPPLPVINANFSYNPTSQSQAPATAPNPSLFAMMSPQDASFPYSPASVPISLTKRLQESHSLTAHSYQPIGPVGPENSAYSLWGMQPYPSVHIRDRHCQSQNRNYNQSYATISSRRYYSNGPLLLDTPSEVPEAFATEPVLVSCPLTGHPHMPTSTPTKPSIDSFGSEANFFSCFSTSNVTQAPLGKWKLKTSVSPSTQRADTCLTMHLQLCHEMEMPEIICVNRTKALGEKARSIDGKIRPRIQWKYLELPRATKGKEKPSRHSVLTLSADLLCASNVRYLGRPLARCKKCDKRERAYSPIHTTASDDRRSLSPSPAPFPASSGESTRFVHPINFPGRRFIPFADGRASFKIRITCYCRDYDEPNGFLIRTALTDYTGTVVAGAISGPIMIKDIRRSKELAGSNAQVSTPSQYRATAHPAPYRIPDTAQGYEAESQTTASGCIRFAYGTDEDDANIAMTTRNHFRLLRHVPYKAPDKN